MAKEMGGLSKWSFSEIKVEGNKFTFSYAGKLVSVVPKTEYTMEVNGEIIDFGPGKLKVAVEKVEQLFTKKTSWMDFFISPAHAWVHWVPITLGVLLLIRMVQIGMEEGDIESICIDLTKEVDSVMDDDPTSEDISDLKVAIRSAKREMRINACANDRKERLFGTSCRMVLDCIQNIEKKVSQSPLAIDNSDRGIAKEVNETNDQTPSSTSSASKQ